VPQFGICNRMYAPVCAAGRTYNNMCLASAACVKEKDATPGRCPKPAAERAPIMGGWSEASDVGGSSKIYRLTAFSLASLAANCTNDTACHLLSTVSLEHVLSAKTQVVAGTNYMIEARTSAGSLRLKIFEQLWSSTLEISEAVLNQTGLSAEDSVFNLLGSLKKLPLDVQIFAAITPKTDPLAALSSAILIGGVPGQSGGHYTGSDAALFAEASEASARGALPVNEDHSHVDPNKEESSAEADEAAPRGCCKALLARCLACGEGLTVEEYCKEHPKASGCAIDAGPRWVFSVMLCVVLLAAMCLIVVSRQLLCKAKPDERPINNAPDNFADIKVDHLKHTPQKGVPIMA